MKRSEIKKILIFISIFLVSLVCISYIVRTNGDIKNRFAGFYAEEKNTIDVLMFGASPVGTSFSPGYMWGKYGFTSYPLSSNTQRPKAIQYLLEEGYKYQKPEVIVVELRMFAYEDKEQAEDTAHIREVTDNMRYSWQRIKTIQGIAEQCDEPIITFYFDIMKYHSNWKMFFLPEEIEKFAYSKKDINKGFQNSSEIMPHDIPIEGSTKMETPIPKEQEECLKSLLDYLEKKNQKTLFVVAPKYNSDDYQQKMNYMKRIVESRGFQYLNMNEYYTDIQFDFTTDLQDGAHTNILGAKKSSELLGRYLSQHYNIQDKREDENYDDWDKSYQKFLEEYESVKIN